MLISFTLSCSVSFSSLLHTSVLALTVLHAFSGCVLRAKVNALVNEARVVVGPMPGVTRDSIPVHWTLVDPSKRRPDRHLKLVDTAGIRKFTMERNPRGGGVQTLWAASAGQSGSSSMLHQSGGGSSSSSGRSGPTATAASVAAAHRHVIGGGAGAALELQLEQEAVNASLKALGMASVVSRA